ncbi:hypothetical protein E2C01_082215 [Portunus trituberculatus]|uniref:Uncharacterized protein n=1 Tax=Portunus trituberculatus TaxID=210409 RepID=A0A5B7J4A4_PORTR|nr:hypothetical protein [Portunus trituberculatus]
MLRDEAPVCNLSPSTAVLPAFLPLCPALPGSSILRRFSLTNFSFSFFPSLPFCLHIQFLSHPPSSSVHEPKQITHSPSSL